jgi:hypothetical protein
MSKLSSLKIVLWMICVYHVLLGLAAFLSEDLAAQVARGVFGLRLDMTPQLSYVVQLLGVYAVIFGLITGLVAIDPLRHRVLLNVVVVLYVLRIVNKLLTINEFEQAFGASMTKVWIDVVLLAAFGAAVFLLRPRAGAHAEA